MEELVYKKKSSYELAPEKTEAAFTFAKDYMRFLDSSKTEREAVETSIAAAEAASWATPSRSATVAISTTAASRSFSSAWAANR